MSRILSNIFGRSKAPALPPDNYNRALDYLKGESDEELLLALEYLQELMTSISPERSAFAFSSHMGLVLNCLDSDTGKVRAHTFTLLRLVYEVRIIQFDKVRRKMMKDIRSAEDADAISAAFALLNSLEIAYRVQFACSVEGAECIAKGIEAVDPGARAAVFSGLAPLLPAVWWYLSSSGDEVDGLYYRAVAPADNERDRGEEQFLKCSWTAEECPRIKENFEELCKDVYARCAQGVVGEASTTDVTGNAVTLADSAQAFDGCCRAMAAAMRASNLRRKGLGLSAWIEALLGGCGGVAPSDADSVSSTGVGPVSCHSGIHATLLHHAIASAFGGFVQAFVHTCVANMPGITARAAIYGTSSDNQLEGGPGLQGAILAGEVLLSLLHDAADVEQQDKEQPVRLLARVKEKFRFGDEKGEEGGGKGSSTTTPNPNPNLRRLPSDPSPLLGTLTLDWAAGVVSVLTNPNPLCARSDLDALCEMLVEVMTIAPPSVAQLQLLPRYSLKILTLLLASRAYNGDPSSPSLSPAADSGGGGGGDSVTRSEIRRYAVAVALLGAVLRSPHSDLLGFTAQTTQQSCVEVLSAVVAMTARFDCSGSGTSVTTIMLPRIAAEAFRVAYIHCPTAVAAVARLRESCTRHAAMTCLRVGLHLLEIRLRTGCGVDDPGCGVKSTPGEIPTLHPSLSQIQQQVASCEAVMVVMEALLPRLLQELEKAKYPSSSRAGGANDNGPGGVAIAWICAARAVCALLLPVDAKVPTGWDAQKSTSNNNGDSVMARSLMSMRMRLKSMLGRTAQAMLPLTRSGLTSGVDDAADALLALMCRHAAALAKVGNSSSACSAGKDLAGMWGELLLPWLEKALDPPAYAGDEGNGEEVAGHGNHDHNHSNSNSNHHLIPEQGVFGAGLPSKSNCSRSSTKGVFSSHYGLKGLRGVVPAQGALRASGAALELGLRTYAEAAFLARSSNDSDSNNAKAAAGELRQLVRGRLQGLLRKRCTVESHPMLAEACANTARLLAAATGGCDGSAVGAADTDPDIVTAATATAGQVDNDVDEEKKDDGGGGGEVAGDWYNPSSLSFGGALSGPLHPRHAANAIAGSPLVPEPDSHDANPVSRVIGALALAPAPSAAPSVAAALAPGGWTDTYNSSSSSSREGSSFVGNLSLAAAIDDVVAGGCYSHGGNSEDTAHEEVAATASNTDADTAFGALDLAAPELVTDRCYSQLSGGADMLTVLGSARYDVHSRSCHVRVRVCNSAGFRIAALRLHASVLIAADVSSVVEAGSAVRSADGIVQYSSDNNGGGSGASDLASMVNPALLSVFTSSPSSLSAAATTPDLVSPLFGYMDGGAVADWDFNVPCFSASSSSRGAGIAPVHIKIRLVFPDLMEESNGDAPSLLSTHTHSPPPHQQQADFRHRAVFGSCSTMSIAPLTLPMAAMLAPYGGGMFCQFSRPAWHDRHELWRHPQKAALRMLPSIAIGGNHGNNSDRASYGVPAAVFEQLWQTHTAHTTVPARIPLCSPLGTYGQEQDHICHSEVRPSLLLLVNQATALVEAGAGGAALPGATYISAAARVALDAIQPAAASNDDGSNGHADQADANLSAPAVLSLERMAWALQSPSGATLCILVTAWEVSDPAAGAAGSSGSRSRAHVEAELRASEPGLLAAASTDDNLTGLLAAVSGDVLGVDVKARSSIAARESAQHKYGHTMRRLPEQLDAMAPGLLADVRSGCRPGAGNTRRKYSGVYLSENFHGTVEEPARWLGPPVSTANDE